MFSKKILFPIAAIAMASFVACGDESNTTAAAQTQVPAQTNDVLPASVEKFFDLDNYTCSETVNKCKTVKVMNLTEPAQCSGVQWESVMLGKPVAGCTSLPSANDPADPANSTDPVANPAVDSSAMSAFIDSMMQSPECQLDPTVCEELKKSMEALSGLISFEELFDVDSTCAYNIDAPECESQKQAILDTLVKYMGYQDSTEEDEPSVIEVPEMSGDVVYCMVPDTYGSCEAIPVEIAEMCETIFEGRLVDICPVE